MPVKGSRGRSMHAVVVPMSAALLVIITLLRLAVSNPIEAVGFLYVIPISLLASLRGWRGGLFGAAAALVLTVVWAMLQDVPLGVIGYCSRAATFASVGALVGFDADQRHKLEREREFLLTELRATALSDPLTGLPNRRAWDERFAHELALARRSGRPLSVAAIDLDKLKQANDALGHEHGDRLIQRCAGLCEVALRETDFIARIGGDEFLALLPDCGAVEAEQIARRMVAGVPSRHSLSIGIATWDGDEDGYELVHRSDRAMYAAKAAGGDRVTLAPGHMGGPLGLIGEPPRDNRRAS
jgi:diguanylate cyclase (GGDEF)-like protein